MTDTVPSKKSSPVEVTLEKSDSGTWKVSESPSPTLKPWQRLWVAAGIVYLLMISGSCFLLMPNRENIDRDMVRSVIEEVHRFDGMAFAGESPQVMYEAARLQGSHAWIAQIRSTYRIGSEGNAGFKKIDHDYRKAVSDLPLKQQVVIFICVIVWLLPMAVLYAIGFVVEWIKRGTVVSKG